MNRLDRLTSLLTSLQSGRWRTAEEFAERYGISIRTVYRDIRALEDAGVPVLSEAGRGYTLMEGYRLPPVMFTRSEAAALLTGEKLLQKQSSRHLLEDYRSAMEKVRAVLRNTDKDFLEALGKKIAVYAMPESSSSAMHERIFPFLQDALAHRTVLCIVHRSLEAEQPLERVVEPLGLLQMGAHWYLAAWCRLRTDYRMFRLDRILQFSETKEVLPEKHPHSLQTFIKNYHERATTVKVVLVFNKETARYVGEQKKYHGWVQERQLKEGTEMTFLTDNIRSFARWVLVWGKGVHISEPGSLQQKVREMACELHAYYAAESVPAENK